MFPMYPKRQNLNSNHCQKVVINNSNNTNNNTINIKTTTSGGSALDALPKQFVVSMKKLFDILDDQHSGFVKFSDIEKSWQDDGCKGLPRGVIDSLRKVTPTSGLLSFERFCAGLKICLLRNQTTDAIQANLFVNNNILKLPKKPPRPPSAPLLEIESPLPTTSWSTNPTATVRPQNIRALSLSQLSPDSAEMEQEDEELESQQNTERRSVVTIFNSPPPPPKPPRSAAVNTKTTSGGILTTSNNTSGAPLGKAEIRHALQNWQMGVLLNEMDLKDKRTIGYGQNQFPPYRGCADGGSSSTTDSTTPTIALYSKKLNSTKRRHTLQNGIDYNMLKRLKQFEEEREVLLLGLDAVDRAREWYLQQITSLQEKIQYLGLMGTHVEQWSEVHQERLNFQRARVIEVNRNLTTLTDTWERGGGFPTHFNLAIRTPNNKNTTASTNGLLQPVDRLRQQNRHLTNEVNLKSNRIALLEREKQALLRDLFVLQERTSISGQCVDGALINVLSQPSPVCSSSSGGLGDADVVY